jgi:hypothetical protein
MKLHGTTEGNLISAIRSANRLRERPVHADTVKFWSDLIQHARGELSSCTAFPPEALKRLVSDLEQEVARRPRSSVQHPGKN